MNTKNKRKKKVKICFVISPIGEDDAPDRRRSDGVLDNIIKPAAAGYKVIRSDHISKAGSITQQIIEYLLRADLVIADLSDNNANVFYELAVRHMIRKPVVQLLQSKKGKKINIPFDIRGMRTIVYYTDEQNGNVIWETPQQELKMQIEGIEEGGEIDNPITIVWPKVLDEFTRLVQLSKPKNKSILDCSQPWLSEWKTHYDLERGPDSVSEKIQISERGGKIFIKSIEAEEDKKYRAVCESYSDYIFGTWQFLKNSTSKGFISLIKSKDSSFCYGYYFGTSPKRIQDYKGEQEIGTWIIAKNEKALSEARKRIKDPNHHFKSDIPISKCFMRDKLYRYHSTRMDRQDIWKYHIISLAQSKDEEVLITPMETKDKMGKPAEYRMDAGRIGPHIIKILRRIGGDEDPTICVFPFIDTINPSNPYYGFGFGLDWDGKPYLSKNIFSWAPRQSFSEIESGGRIPAREATILEEEWNQQKLTKFLNGKW